MATECIKIDSYSDVLRPEDIMEILHIGRNTVYGMLKDGHIHCIKIGRKYLIPKEYLREFLTKREVYRLGAS